MSDEAEQPEAPRYDCAHCAKKSFVAKEDLEQHSQKDHEKFKHICSAFTARIFGRHGNGRPKGRTSFAINLPTPMKKKRETKARFQGVIASNRLPTVILLGLVATMDSTRLPENFRYAAESAFARCCSSLPDIGSDFTDSPFFSSVLDDSMGFGWKA